MSPPVAHAKIRLFLEHPLGTAQTVPLSRDQAHYLFAVMRLKAGDTVLGFDGETGEWLAEITEAGKRAGMLRCLEHTRPLQRPPDLWLLFAPLKKARTDFIVEKATELGAARILPVQTEFTNVDRVRRERLQAHAVEAAEQCGSTYVPPVHELARLDDVLRDWQAGRRLMVCDEALAGQHVGLTGDRGSWAILIGPEGGFSMAERARLAGLPHTRAVSLGPRILRADTAAVAAITLWQATFGDWT